MNWNGKNILISRTDNLGDVMLTLPLAGYLKAQFPDAKIFFLGKAYTRAIIECCRYVDHFLDIADFKNSEVNHWLIDVCIHVFPEKKLAFKARKLGIPIRIGTRNRWFHWLSCNFLPALSRKKSDLHEAMLNIRLVQLVLDEKRLFSKKDLFVFSGFGNVYKVPELFTGLLLHNKIKIILHPKSKGSAREWGLENFGALAAMLADDGRFQVFVTGTKEEGHLLKDWLYHHPYLIDMTGKLDMEAFIAFIASCDAMVAASTGPLHIASALGRKAVGIYAPMKPIHPGRWAPIGPESAVLVEDKECDACRFSQDCACIRKIGAQRVFALLASA
jgi:ADP-heptose:LPS heptosyltransferase